MSSYHTLFILCHREAVPVFIEYLADMEQKMSWHGSFLRHGVEWLMHTAEQWCGVDIDNNRSVSMHFCTDFTQLVCDHLYCMQLVLMSSRESQCGALYLGKIVRWGSRQQHNNRIVCQCWRLPVKADREQTSLMKQEPRGGLVNLGCVTM